MVTYGSPWRVAWSGASLAFTASLVYASVFAVLASLRAALQILGALRPGEGRWMTIIATANSIFIAAIQFAILFGALAALIMGLTWLVVYGLSRWLNRQSSPGREAWIALATSLGVAILLQALLWSTEGLLHAVLWRSASAYLLWLGIPCLIFVGLTTLAWSGWGGRKII